LKSGVLLTAEFNLVDVGAFSHLQSQTDVVAGTKLVHQPAQTMRVVRFVTGHDVHISSRQKGAVVWLGNGA